MKPKARYIKEALGFAANHVLYRADGIWYHHLKDFPAILFDSGGYLWILSKADYEAKEGLVRTKDLNIPAGISNLEGYQYFSPGQMRLIQHIIGEDFDNETIRRIREVNTIQRNKKLVVNLKKLYENCCQICGLQLEISKDVYYSEVHHIRPLGNPHNGPDIKSNMLCVCPNHHVLLDMGSIEISLANLIILNHAVDQSCIDYHNNQIRTLS